MKRKIIIISLILAGMLITPHKTSAHVLLTGGSIGAVLHIDPDDDPIALQKSSFFFDFKDRTNSFNPATCDCQFELFENGKQIYTQPLFASNETPTLTNANVTYIFPKRDIYTLKITGKPQVGNTFTPFTLTYDIRVSRINNKPSQKIFISGHLIHTIGIGIIAFLVIFAIIKQTLKEKKLHPEVKKK